jgi:hypothetical protein
MLVARVALERDAAVTLIFRDSVSLIDGISVNR